MGTKGQSKFCLWWYERFFQFPKLAKNNDDRRERERKMNGHEVNPPTPTPFALRRQQTLFLRIKDNCEQPLLPAYSIPILPKSALTFLTTTLRLPQDPYLPITRRIRRHIQPPHGIPRQPRRPKAARAIPRPIPLTCLNRRIEKYVLRRRSARQWLHRRIIPISTTLKLDSHKLESRDGLAVPATMVGNIHGRAISIELAVDGGGVGLQC